MRLRRSPGHGKASTRSARTSSTSRRSGSIRPTRTRSGTCWRYEIRRTGDLSPRRGPSARSRGRAAPSPRTGARRRGPSLVVFRSGEVRAVPRGGRGGRRLVRGSRRHEPAAYMLETTIRSFERVRAACETMSGYRWSLELLELGQRARFDEPDRTTDARAWILVGGSSAEGRGRIADATAKRSSRRSEGAEGRAGLRWHRAGRERAGRATSQQRSTSSGRSGYLPSSLPVDVTEDDRYDDLVRTGGERFSPLEPLTYWRGAAG